MHFKFVCLLGHCNEAVSNVFIPYRCYIRFIALYYYRLHINSEMHNQHQQSHIFFFLELELGRKDNNGRIKSLEVSEKN